MDVGAWAVHSGLRTLQAQALRVAKYANTVPLNNQSLFGGGLKTVVAKATSAARDYAAMAEGFVQAGLHHPKPHLG